MKFDLDRTSVWQDVEPRETIEINSIEQLVQLHIDEGEEILIKSQGDLPLCMIDKVIDRHIGHGGTHAGGIEHVQKYFVDKEEYAIEIYDDYRE